eukprot:2287082-Rhodomonas_salina.1
MGGIGKAPGCRCKCWKHRTLSGLSRCFLAKCKPPTGHCSRYEKLVVEPRCSLAPPAAAVTVRREQLNSPVADTA